MRSQPLAEVPSRRGYPGYLYSDPAGPLRTPARGLHGPPGSVTQVPVLTIPAGDATYPSLDLTGYITEGQIVLSRAVARTRNLPAVRGPRLPLRASCASVPGRTHA